MWWSAAFSPVPNGDQHQHQIKFILGYSREDLRKTLVLLEQVLNLSSAGDPAKALWATDCQGQEQRFPLAGAGALEWHCLNSAFLPTVPPSMAAPGTFDPALLQESLPWFCADQRLGPISEPRFSRALSQGAGGALRPWLPQSWVHDADVSVPIVTWVTKATKRNAGLRPCVSVT